MLSRCSPVQLCVTPWTVVHQTPLSMRFSRKEYWSGLPCPPPGVSSTPGDRTPYLLHLHWQAGSLLLAPLKIATPASAWIVPIIFSRSHFKCDIAGECQHSWFSTSCQVKDMARPAPPVWEGGLPLWDEPLSPRGDTQPCRAPVNQLPNQVPCSCHHLQYFFFPLFGGFLLFFYNLQK